MNDISNTSDTKTIDFLQCKAKVKLWGYSAHMQAAKHAKQNSVANCFTRTTAVK